MREKDHFAHKKLEVLDIALCVLGASGTSEEF